MAAAAIIAARKNAKLREEREANMTVDDVRRMYEEDQKKLAESKIIHKTKHQEPSNYEDRPWMKKCLVRVANPFQVLTESDPFNLFVIGVIMMAGVVVGLQTDRYVETLDVIFWTDNVILAVFTFEVVAKVVAEGWAPWRYWCGPEYKWNNFDFVIVLLSFPNPFLAGGGFVKLLRLVRLARLAKLIKKIPQLQMIVMGLIGGFKSIGYIMFLLFIVLYLFGIIGMMLFGMNDPFHFGSLGDSIITLFRASTLEDWTDIMYINFFGCDSRMYDSGIYHVPSLGRTGVYHADGCPMLCHERDNPMALKEVGKSVGEGRGHGVVFRPNSYTVGTRFQAIGMVYWHVFILLSALVMLSLFIGAVTMSMTESMDEMKKEADRSKRIKEMLKNMEKKKAREMRKKKKAAERAEKRESAGLARRLTSRSLKYEEEEIENELFEETESLKSKRTNNLFKLAWDKHSMEKLIDWKEEESKKLFPKCPGMCHKYYLVSKRAKVIAEHPHFVNFITLVIVIAGIMVGIQMTTNEQNINEATCNPDLPGCSGYAPVTNFSDNILVINSQDPNSTLDCVKRWEVSLDCPLSCMEKSTGLHVMEILDLLILIIFTFEVVVKIVAKFDEPLRYFYENRHFDRWNCFDFFIVVGSLVPSEQGGMLVILRLLRLLRVLKLLKAFPELQVIVEALIQGLGSITYIAMILVLVFFAFGVFAMICFQENDPWHFGTLPNAMYSLFRASTLEDWTDIMYTNMIGCANYGAFVMCEDVGHGNCAARMDDPKDLTVFHELYCCCREKSFMSTDNWWIWSGFIFFFIFCVIGALVLMTLFIGVITTAMEEAQSVQKKQKDREAQVAEAVKATNLDVKTIEKYKSIFKIIDEDDSGSIDEEELREALHKVNLDGNLDAVYILIGNEERKDIDFVSFLIMMKLLKEQALAQEKGEDITVPKLKEDGEEAEKTEEDPASPVVPDVAPHASESTGTKEIELAPVEWGEGDSNVKRDSNAKSDEENEEGK